jgi:hypothetical protein
MATPGFMKFRKALGTARAMEDQSGMAEDDEDEEEDEPEEEKKPRDLSITMMIGEGRPKRQAMAEYLRKLAEVHGKSSEKRRRRMSPLSLREAAKPMMDKMMGKKTDEY